MVGGCGRRPRKRWQGKAPCCVPVYLSIGSRRKDWRERGRDSSACDWFLFEEGLYEFGEPVSQGEEIVVAYVPPVGQDMDLQQGMRRERGDVAGGNDGVVGCCKDGESGVQVVDLTGFDAVGVKVFFNTAKVDAAFCEAVCHIPDGLNGLEGREIVKFGKELLFFAQGVEPAAAEIAAQERMLVEQNTGAAGVENRIDGNGPSQIWDWSQGMAQCHADCKTAAEGCADEEKRSACGEKADLLGDGVDFLDQGGKEDSPVEVVCRPVVAQIETHDIISCANQCAAQD